MCQIFASQPPDSYVFETRSMRLNGQGTSVRLERVFWTVLERISAGQDLSLPKFISALHTEILEIRGEAPNFTSHLRCICMVFLDRRGDTLLEFETDDVHAAPLSAEAAE